MKINIAKPLILSFIIFCNVNSKENIEKNDQDKKPLSFSAALSDDWKFSITTGINYIFKSPFALDFRYNYTKHYQTFKPSVHRATNIDYWHRFKFGFEAHKYAISLLQFFSRISYVPSIYPKVRTKENGEPQHPDRDTRGNTSLPIGTRQDIERRAA